MLPHVEAPARDWVKGLRLRMKLTQQQLADEIGVHVVTVAHWESNTGHRIGGKNRAKLNTLARLHRYPPLAPARKKSKRPSITVHLPEGWVEKEDRDVQG